MSKVVLGFSGGVDSAVAAKLLQKAGHQVYGLYLDNADRAAREAACRLLMAGKLAEAQNKYNH